MSSCMKDGFVKGLALDGGRFISEARLNHGSFGMVFSAKDTTTGELVAIKCLSKPSLVQPVPLENESDFLIELACHDRLGYHQNIVNLKHAFETPEHMFLVLELCANGDLYEAIASGCGPLQTEHVRSFMLQLVDAVEFMHSRGLYHRDIKPENIFLTVEGAMKLGDFGLSTSETWTFEAAVGSDRYMAPEQYEPADSGYSPAQADLWAIGICLLNVLFSRNPFVTPSDKDLLFADFVRDKKSLFDVFPSMSIDTFTVIDNALSLDPKKRSLASIRQALMRVQSFTSDEETLDEFCLDDKPLVPTSANRQPLRTPSIGGPLSGVEGAFPWSRVVSPRQLSTIHDDKESEIKTPTPGSPRLAGRKLFSSTSLAAVIESSLSQSVKALTLREPVARKSKATISESVPANVTRPKLIPTMSSIFGKKKSGISKSWSEMVEEDDSDDDDEWSTPMAVPVPQHHGHIHPRSRNWSISSTDSSSGLEIDLKPTTASKILIPGSSLATPKDLPELGIFGDSSLEDVNSFEDRPLPNVYSRDLPVYSPPAKRSSLIDRWSALGNRRRAAPPAEEKERSRTRWGRSPAKKNIAQSVPAPRVSFNLAPQAQSQSQSTEPATATTTPSRPSLLRRNTASSDKDKSRSVKFLDWRRNGTTLDVSRISPEKERSPKPEPRFRYVAPPRHGHTHTHTSSISSVQNTPMKAWTERAKQTQQTQAQSVPRAIPVKNANANVKTRGKKSQSRPISVFDGADEDSDKEISVFHDRGVFGGMDGIDEVELDFADEPAWVAQWGLRV